MEKAGLVAGFLVALAVAVLKLRQFARWTRCQATFLSVAGSWSYTGQPLPVAFRLADGRMVQGSVRLYSRAGPPAAGTLLWIIYDPDDPTRVEWASVRLVLAVIAAGLVAGLVAVVASSS